MKLWSDANPSLSSGHGRELPASRGPTAGQQLVLSGLAKLGGKRLNSGILLSHYTNSRAAARTCVNANVDVKVYVQYSLLMTVNSDVLKAIYCSHSRLF